MIRITQRALVLFLLLLPFFGLLMEMDLDIHLDWDELGWALKNTLLQALGSTGVTLFVGLLGSFGLLWLDSKGFSKTLKWVEGLLLLPSLLPSLYVILASMQMVDPFPMGRIGIIFVHTMMNFGMIAVILSQILRRQIVNLSETALILGVGFWKFLSRVVIPLLSRDLFRLGFFIFALCFTSFAVPLTVGGGRGTTIEVLIYEKLRYDLNWNQAITLSLLQIFFLLGLSLMGTRSEGGFSPQRRSVKILPQLWCLVVVLFLTLWLYGSFFLGVVEGLVHLRSLFEIKEALLLAMLNTYLIALIGGAVLCMSYLFLAFLWPDRWIERIMGGFVSPSTVMIGFGLILVSQRLGILNEWIRLGLGFWILFFPTLFRWGGLSELKMLEAQIQNAQILGAGPWKIFSEVTLPQVLARATWLGGVGSFWIAGEFALSRLLMNQDRTLGLIAQSFLSSYRLSLGTLLCALMILCGLVAFLTLRGIDYVYSRKFDN
ncbi:MAG: iron ABC transporter permease [Bdellovibrionaceae bacterium]|nr:iron ABC transporter permease [Pseudobdellovibrionaceae bacterium]